MSRKLILSISFFLFGLLCQQGAVYSLTWQGSTAPTACCGGSASGAGSCSSGCLEGPKVGYCGAVNSSPPLSGFGGTCAVEGVTSWCSSSPGGTQAASGGPADSGCVGIVVCTCTY